MFMAILAIILTLVLVVGIHEAGHALAARILGIRIQKISIGFGRPLIQWTSKSGCDWIWAMWPLGGYVQLLNSRSSPVAPEDYSDCFDKKPVWVRIVVLLAGAAANVVTAGLAFLLVFYLGFNYRPAQVESVQPSSVAAQAGILAGDKLVAVDDYPTPSWQEIGMQLVIFWGKKDVKVRVDRDGQMRDVGLDLSAVKFAGQDRSLLAALGIKPNLDVARQTLSSFSLREAAGRAQGIMIHLLYFFLMIIKQLVTGVIPFSILLGPLGIFAASVSSLTQGLVVFLYFVGSLSLAVALINLFPIPGLDGGSVVYALIEKVRSKPVSVAMEVLLHRLVVIVFVIFLIQLVMNDLARFVG